jgi:hypothetical protein
MTAGIRLFTARSVRWLDAGVVVWIVAWAALGVLIWHDIRAQAELSQNVVKIGSAVRDTGDALGVVGGLPLVGGSIGSFADKIKRTGQDVMTSGEASHSGILRVAVVSGIGVGLLPAALVLLLYVPVRLAWRRDVRAVRAGLAASADDPAFEHHLARRAVDVLPWDGLRAVSGDPWRDIAAGDFRALADAELARLGVQRP